MNWETIITPGKDSVNYISYSFINNGLIFNIISIKNVGYELYINNKSFKELEKLSKKKFFSDIINNESKTSCLINKGNKNKENKEINLLLFKYYLIIFNKAIIKYHVMKKII